MSAPGLYTRLLATEVSGNLPGDVGVIPTFDPSNEAAAAALARDTRMVPLFRDLALTGTPQEALRRPSRPRPPSRSPRIRAGIVV